MSQQIKLKIDSKKMSSVNSSVIDQSSMRSSYPNRPIHTEHSDDAIKCSNMVIPINLTTYQDQVELRK